MTATVEHICNYLATRGFEATNEDKAEILARMNGHASADAHREFNEKAQVFTAYKGDVNDFDAKGNFSGARTRATLALCEGSKDIVLRSAFLEANSVPGFTVVYDGNGKLCETYDKHETSLGLYYALASSVLKPEAVFRDDLALEDQIVEIQMTRWSEVGANLARFRNEANNRPWESRDNCMLFVLEEGNQKILWRERF